MPKKGGGNTLLEETLSQKKVANFLNRKYKKTKSSHTKSIYSYGLAQFQTFLREKYPEQKYTLETILPLLSEKKIKVYPLFDDFIEYLEKRNVSPRTIKDYLTPVRSYFQYEDEYEIDVSKFKDRVTIPQINREREEAIDVKIIGNILKACNNRRLKAYLSILASSGVRSMEGISLRIKDVELSEDKEEPSIIHVRAQYAKTRTPRDVFITGEATGVLQQWLSFKYRRGQKPQPDDLIFTNKILKETDLQSDKIQLTFQGIYIKLNAEFNKILETIDLGERKDNSLRHKITFHSFRRFVKTTLSDQVGRDFSEYILGHKNDMGYYTKTEGGAIEQYKTAMKQLTFLDIEQFQTTGKNINKQILELRKENEILRKRMNKIYEAKDRDYDEVKLVIRQAEAISKLMKEENLTDEEALHRMSLHPRPSFTPYGVFYSDRTKEEEDERRIEQTTKLREEKKRNMYDYYKRLPSYRLKIEKEELSKEFHENYTACPSCKTKGPYYSMATCGREPCFDEYATDEEVEEYNNANDKRRTLLEKMYAVGLLKDPEE